MKQDKNKLFIAVCIFLGFLTACIDDENVDAGVVTNASTPTLSDIEIEEITASSVTLKGEVVSAQGYPVTERGIVWGTSDALDIEKDFHKSLTDNSSDSIRLTADELKGATPYYFSLYAKNRMGTGYSKVIEKTTNDGLGIVRTFYLPASIRATTASAGGLITDRGEGSLLERGIYYSQSRSMAAKDSIISLIEEDSFVCDLSGLRASTDYYIQAYVKNEFGIFRGDIEEFTTNPGLPVMEFISVEPKSNEAQVIARVVSIGDASLVRRGFCWNRTGDPQADVDNTLLVAIGSSGGLPFVGEIRSLESNQVYYVRAFAENSFGIAYTTSYQFITSSDMPTVITLDPISVSNGSAIFGGTILDVGASNVTRIGVCYAANKANPTIYDTNVEIIINSPITEMHSPYTFYTEAITELKGGTTYSIRAYAINGTGGGVPQYADAKILQTPPIFTQESESFKGETRIEGSSAYFVIGERGYLLGGDIGTNYSNSLWSYNPVLNNERWLELNKYDGGSMKWQSAAVMETRVYVLGGLGVGLDVKDDFYVYNNADNLWFPRSKGPDAAYSRAGFALNNEVFYVGGMKDTANNEVWGYQVYLNMWSQKADFPVNQYGGVALTIDDNVYVGLGKNTSGVGNKQLWRSSGSLTTWSPEPVGTDLSGNVLAGVVCNKKIYVIDKSPFNEYFIFEYDPAGQVWKRKSKLPSHYWNILFMYTIRDRIYIGFADNDKVVVYDPLWDN